MWAKHVVPRQIRTRIRRHFSTIAERNRAEMERCLPKVLLGPEHVNCCRLLPSRKDLLAMVPKGAIVAELGVNEGEFSAEILDVCDPKQLHLVDIWGSTRYHNGLYDQVNNRFRDQIAHGTVYIHRMLSVEAASLFADDFFDFVYIDTAHDYLTTRDELMAYAPKVKTSGLLAGHDYNKGNWVKGYRYGVIEAVHEFASNENWKLAALTANYPESPSFALQRMGAHVSF